MVPIYIKKPNGGDPPAETHYIVARNGTFLRKKMWWVDAIVPVSEIRVLNPEKSLAQLLLPPLPSEILAKALKLAKSVYDSSKSEVCLLLYYNAEAGYELTVPEQDVTPGSIQYDASERKPGTLCVGTIHSHGVLEAYHSTTDIDDEEYTDGVHITLGNLNLYPIFSLSAEIVVNGIRFHLESSWFQGLCAERKMYRIDHPAIDSWDIPTKWLDAIYESEREEKKK